MRAFLKSLSQGTEADDSTVNVKRTTLITVGLIVVVVMASMCVLAFYASFKALSAASAVDDAWQTQRVRILDIEARSVQASTDSNDVKVNQSNIQKELVETNNRLSWLQHTVQQSVSYRSTKDAMEADRAAVLAKADAAKADAQKLVVAAEQKGVENFDRLLLARLQERWVRPEGAAAGSTVDLVVHFAPDGTITNAMVPRPSGVKEVDDSVIKAAADLAKIPEMTTVNRGIYMKYLQQREVKFLM